jgi:WD40 repeat protein
MESKPQSDYKFEAQIQIQKMTAVTLLTAVSAAAVHLPPLSASQLPKQVQSEPVHIAFTDVNGNVKLAESGLGSNRSVLLTSFQTKAPASPYTVLCDHPSKNYLVLGNQSGKIEFMKISSKSDNVQAFKLHLSKINSISFCDQTQRIVSASNDKTVKVYDVSGVVGAKKHPIFVQSFSLQSFALKAEILNGVHLLALESKAFRVFDVETKNEVFSYDMMPKDKLVDYHLLSDNCVCLVSEDATFRILNLDTQKLERAFTLANRSVRRTRLAKDKGVIIACGKTGAQGGQGKSGNGSPSVSTGRESIFIINVLDPDVDNLVDYEPRSEVTDVLIAPDASYFAFSTMNDSISIYRQSESPVALQLSKKVIGVTSTTTIKAKENRNSKALTSSTVMIKKTTSVRQTTNLANSLVPEAPSNIGHVPAINDDKTPCRTTPIQSHNSHNVPLTNLLSKNKSESNQPIEFDITNLITSMQKTNGNNEIMEQIQNLSIFLTGLNRPKSQVPDSQIDDYSKKLFNSVPFEVTNKSYATPQNDLTEVRTVDYNITETKHNRTDKVSIDYNDLENFIKQREEYIQLSDNPTDEVKVEEDFSFKVTIDRPFVENPQPLDDIDATTRSFAIVQAPEHESMNEPSPDGEDNPEDENPFDQVLGKTFKTRDAPQIVIIDQSSPSDVQAHLVMTE